MPPNPRGMSIEHMRSILILLTALSLRIMKWRIAMNGEEVRIWKEFTAASCKDLSQQSIQG
jgi:hypothetical protein